jgi:hypothetical protein
MARLRMWLLVDYPIQRSQQIGRGSDEAGVGFALISQVRVHMANGEIALRMVFRFEDAEGCARYIGGFNGPRAGSVLFHILIAD